MRTSGDLTAKQASLLKFLQKKIAEDGRPPTIREIGAHFGFKSTGTTRDHLFSLTRKGYLKRATPRKSRAITLSRPVVFRIPILGQIMAGMPDLAFEEIQGYVPLDELLPDQERRIFALKVKGDSMTEKGIQEGDIAIVRRQRLADDGDVVAALIDSEATIKILKKKKDEFYLLPANKAYPEIHKPFSLLGRVIAVLKKF